MRFDDLAVRLATAPADLPAPADNLTAVFTGSITARPPDAPLDPGAVRSAAVLVLLFPDEAGDARVVLTERVTRDGHADAAGLILHAESGELHDSARRKSGCRANGSRSGGR